MFGGFEEGPKKSADEAKKENPKVSGEVVDVTTDQNFPGSVIVKTKDAEGRMVGYAIRKNGEGQFEGNQLGYDAEGNQTWTQQLHESDIENLRQKGILDRYEQAQRG